MSYPKVSKLFLSLILLISLHSFADTIKVKVTNCETGEPLTDATVELEKGGSKLYTIVNRDGSYSLRKSNGNNHY